MESRLLNFAVQAPCRHRTRDAPAAAPIILNKFFLPSTQRVQSLQLLQQPRQLLLSSSSFRPFPTVWCRSTSVPGEAETEEKLKSNAKVYDEQTLLLKEKARDIIGNLEGSCIYLIGMMGSGKTTVGELVANALGYKFIDSDKMIEKATGSTIAELFKLMNEDGFRDTETEVLKQLSDNVRAVISTGGGIVVRQVNWSYLSRGITVWLDVPLEILAERVVAAGSRTRPLLGGDSAYDQAFERLSNIFTSRASSYANADAKVSLQKISASTCKDVRDITPLEIAFQVLDELENLIRKKQTNVTSRDPHSKS